MYYVLSYYIISLREIQIWRKFEFCSEIKWYSQVPNKQKGVCQINGGRSSSINRRGPNKKLGSTFHTFLLKMGKNTSESNKRGWGCGGGGGHHRVEGKMMSIGMIKDTHFFIRITLMYKNHYT